MILDDDSHRLPLLTKRAVLRRRLLLLADRPLSTANAVWSAVLAPRRLFRRLVRLRRHDSSANAESHHLDPVVADLVDQAESQGLPRGAALAAIAEARPEAANVLARELVRDMPRMFRERRALYRSPDRRLKAIWGEAFDSFEAIYVALHELGSTAQEDYEASADPTNDALVALMGRSSLVLSEVHALMVAGFPLGAHARSRSLYETSVVASVIGTHGRSAGLEDLASRFLAHPVAEQKRDIDRARTNGDVIDEAVAAEVAAELDALTHRFGSRFAKENGWAGPLFPDLKPRARITFEMLDRKAGHRSLDRADYRFAGHHVHSSSWTLALTTYNFRGSPVQLTGPTNIGFEEPARIALYASLDAAHAMLQGLAPSADEYHRLSVAAVEQLAQRALALCAEAENEVMRREAKLVESLDDWWPYSP